MSRKYEELYRFGGTLAKFREKKCSESFAHFCKLYGFNYNTWWKYEINENVPNRHILVNILNTLNLSLSDLFLCSLDLSNIRISNESKLILESYQNSLFESTKPIDENVNKFDDFTNQICITLNNIFNGISTANLAMIYDCSESKIFNIKRCMNTPNPNFIREILYLNKLTLDEFILLSICTDKLSIYDTIINDLKSEIYERIGIKTV